MTELRWAMNDYLTVRRQLGFELKEPGRRLEQFVGLMERAGSEHVTSELALMWAMSVSAHPYTWRRRLGVVRGFARYLSTIDPDTEVPSEDLLRASLPRVAPYLYSPAEIEALMTAARGLTPRLRATTFETVIGLLAVSGLRRGEALALDRADVDLDDGAAEQTPRGAATRLDHPGAAGVQPPARPILAQTELAGVLRLPPGRAADRRRVQPHLCEAHPQGRPGGQGRAGASARARSQTLVRGPHADRLVSDRRADRRQAAAPRHVSSGTSTRPRATGIWKPRQS